MAKGVIFVSLSSMTFPLNHCLQYTDGLRAKEQEEREARLAKLRPSIRNMLKGNPNVFHYTTFATADKLFAQHPIWQQAKIEAERKLIFEEYIAELKQREVVRGLIILTVIQVDLQRCFAHCSKRAAPPVLVASQRLSLCSNASTLTSSPGGELLITWLSILTNGRTIPSCRNSRLWTSC